ncbi:MAG: L,D-transpeptidase family protein [Gammaproteobacteria bacterium]|nr:L,D-transpeptidase family protein [Gammaproteobacteria bacterium]
MRVLTFQGKEVDPASVDWSRYQGKNLPYMIRQDPGPDNALGRVKFMFPNKHHVYLHDTPSRDLFRQSERAFSSGCIRIEQAEILAKVLLARQDGHRNRSTRRSPARTARCLWRARYRCCCTTGPSRSRTMAISCSSVISTSAMRSCSKRWMPLPNPRRQACNRRSDAANRDCHTNPVPVQ